MTNTELQRHELRNKLAEVLGDAAMETLMGHLPPSGWADVARKDDIALLRTDMVRLEERLEMKVDIRIEQLRSEMYRLFNRQLVTFTTIQLTFFSIFTGVILKFG